MSDPLAKVSTPQRELFDRFAAAADGFSAADVGSAAVNVLINSIRQACPNWQQAETAFDDIVGRSKQILKDHYDAAGRKKGVFPYDQGLQVTQLINRNDLKKH